MSADVLQAIVGLFVRQGAAITGSIGFLLAGLGLYTTLPCGTFGWALFGFSAAVFLIAGGLRRG